MSKVKVRRNQKIVWKRCRTCRGQGTTYDVEFDDFETCLDCEGTGGKWEKLSQRSKSNGE